MDLSSFFTVFSRKYSTRNFQR